MDFKFSNIYGNLDKFINGPVINLAEADFCDPWFIGLICLLAIERQGDSGAVRGPRSAS